MSMRIGLISDTHGTLRPDVFEHFDGSVDVILHAGDIGGTDILDELRAIAPVYAVHGNTDGLEVHREAPETVELELEGWKFALTHGHTLGSPTPSRLADAFPGADIIIYGHTHRPLIERAGGKLVVNPGAAGPARFNLRPSIAVLTLAAGNEPPAVELIELG